MRFWTVYIKNPSAFIFSNPNPHSSPLKVSDRLVLFEVQSERISLVAFSAFGNRKIVLESSTPYKKTASSSYLCIALGVTYFTSRFHMRCFVVTRVNVMGLRACMVPIQ